MSRGKSTLLNVSKIVFWDLVEFHHAHIDQRIFAMRPYFGQVERVEAELPRLCRSHDLDLQRPSWKIFPVNSFNEIPLGKIRVMRFHPGSFVIRKILDAL